ncbi:unnamed protein product [Prunus armeniaca]|uniref:Uncharacterized protein n=1 Tax=Prunus armeniaca TaxID=36596 RepID=A0A6J5TEP9_PRUAR|nr:unnamed protein product [Prunus armeniaca]
MGRAGFELGWRMRLDYAARRYDWAEMQPDLVAGEYCRLSPDEVGQPKKLGLAKCGLALPRELGIARCRWARLRFGV